MVEDTQPNSERIQVELQQLKRLELLSIVEATTLVLLVCAGVPAKHIFGWPEGSRYLGPIHGIAFLAYCWTALQTVAGGGWVGRDIVRLFLVAFIPFAGYFNILWLHQRMALTRGPSAGEA